MYPCDYDVAWNMESINNYYLKKERNLSGEGP